MACLSFFSPPKMISSSCMSVEKQYIMKFSGPSSSGTVWLRRVSQL